MAQVYLFPHDVQRFEAAVDRAGRKRRTTAQNSAALRGEDDVLHCARTGAVYTNSSNVIGFPSKRLVQPVLAIDDDDALGFAEAVTIRSVATFDDIDRLAAEEIANMEMVDDDDFI